MPENAAEPGFRRIAWDRVSFEVPEQWELASYRWPKPGCTIIELEDDFSICLDGQWQWSDDDDIMGEFLKRMETRDGDLAKRADHKDTVNDLPPNWSACVYSFSRTVPDKDNNGMAIAKNQIFHATCLGNGFACSFQIQSTPECPFPLDAVGRRFVETFELHRGEMIPWELFDIAITMPKAFQLRNAQFSIGSKHLIFEQKRRTLHVWILSCADVILKDAGSLEAWCCGFLNSQGRIRSLVFKPAAGGGLRWNRRFPMIITHREEIGAFCFRWDVRATHEAESNRIVIWAYNYRRRSDMDWLPGWLTKI